MHNKITVHSYRVYSSREQARFIREEAKVLLEKANEFSTNSRRINRRSANKVLARSLQKTRGLPFSIRKHQALTELSNYISLAKYNKVVGLEASNTDLLSVSHPRSTRMHAMTASAVAEAQMRWVLDDPRIKDETVKGLLASAMFSPIDSPEHKYSMTRLENMPQGQVPLEVLLAAANPFAGKNSAAARRARESVQLSDRFERWINMGASLGKRATDGFRVYVARNDGSTKSLSGELLNQNMFDPNLVDVEMGKGKVATVPTKLGEGLEAFIKSKDSEDGYSPAEAKVPSGAQVLPEDSIVISDAPSIYRKDEEMKNGAIRYTDDKYDVVKFNNPKEAQTAIGEGQKRAAELDKPEPKLFKKGDTDPDSGKQFWNPDEPVFAVYRRGKNTPLAFAQSWKDVNNEILRDEPNLDEDEGRKYTRPEPQTADDNVPLLDQADDIFKPTKKPEQKEKKKVSSFPYEVPDRAYEFNPNEEYTPEFGFDDPVTIANDQTPEDLEDALLTSVEPVSDTEKATGYAPISFTDGSEQEVPAEAIAAAIREQGGDAEMALAQAYDKIAGDNKNVEALDKSRGAKDDKDLEEKDKKADELLKKADKESKKMPKPTADDILEEEIEKPEPEAKLPEEVSPIKPEELEGLEEEPKDRYVPSLLKGLSEDELTKYKEDGDYRPYLPKNADVDAPEGVYKLDPTPVDPAKNLIPEALQSEYPEYTVTDLAKENTDKELTSQLENAITGKGPQGLGFGELNVVDPNSESSGAPVSAEALRDALQLNGKDTNAIIDKINKKAEKAKAKLKPKAPVEETPVAEQPPAKPSIEGKDPLKLDDPFKPEDWIEADGPFADLLNSNENFTRLEGLGDLIDINSALSRQYKTGSDDLKEITGGDFGDEVEAIDERDFEGGPAGKVQYALKILNEAGWSSRGKYDKLETTKGKLAALKDAKDVLEDALNDLKTDKKETAAINSVLKSIDKEIKKLEKEQAKADKEEEAKSRKKIITYKRVGSRTLLKPGAGGAFKDTEIANLLDENGFDFVETIERPDGDPIRVYAEVATQTDEEFKAFARKLRDDFNIDVQPRPATTMSPAQEPIDFDSPKVSEIKPVGKGPDPVENLPDKINPIGDTPMPEIEVIESPEPQAAPSGPPGGPPPVNMGGPPPFSRKFLLSLLRAIREGRLNRQSFPRLTWQEQGFFDSLIGRSAKEQIAMVKEMMALLGHAPETEEERRQRGIRPLSPDDELEIPESAVPHYKNENGDFVPAWMRRVEDGVIFDIRDGRIISEPGDNEDFMSFPAPTRPDLPKEIRENDLIFEKFIDPADKRIAPEDQRRIRSEDGALFDGNGKFVGYVDETSFNLDNLDMVSWLSSYYKKLGVSPEPAPKTNDDKIFELEQELDILEEMLNQEELEELEQDRVIKRINDIREEIGQLLPFPDQRPEEPKPIDEEIEEAVKEVIDETKAKNKKSPYEGLLARIKKKLIERGQKRFGIDPSVEAVQDALIEIIGEPRKAYDIAGLIRNYQIKRDREGGAGKNPFDLTREEMIKRLMWFKWGAGAYKNESTYIQMAMKEYEKELKSTSNEDLIAMLDLIFDEMDAQIIKENEEKQRRNEVAEARAKKRREREDKLLNEGKEEEEGEEATPAKAKKVKRLIPGGKTEAGDNLDYLPAGTIVTDGRGTEYRKNEDGTWDQVTGQIGGNPWLRGITLDPENGYEIKTIPGYDENAPGTGIVEPVQLHKPREGDYVKMPDGTWKRIVKLERTKRKDPSDKAGKEDATIEKFIYTFDDGTTYEVTTTNGSLSLNEYRERLDVVRSADLVGETPKEVLPEEAPLPPLSADAKEIVKALVDRRRKIQRKIDKADLDETTTAAKRKALKDELDEVTRIIDSLVMGIKPAETPATPETPTTPEASSEEPASSAQLLEGVTTNNLKPGDVLVNDHFTITKIEREGTKRVNVGGKTQDIPAYRVSGYFPGSVEQSSKVWSEDYAPAIYRGATPPAKGDLPELNQPKANDDKYGAEYVWPNQTEVQFKGRKLYAPKNKELEAEFLKDYEAYDEERLRRKALWEAPKISKENNDNSNSPITPTNTIYVENVPASDVKVGDIAFRKNKLGAGEFFTVTKVVGTENGMTTLEGHYVGHQTQTKEWRSGTTIDVIRGEKNLPAAGDKEPLDRPDKSLPNSSALEKERKAKIAEADKGYTPNFPTKAAEQGITPLSTKPQLPAFYGTAEELLALGDGPAILEALNASENGYVVFDFETIGKDVTNVLDPDAPIQVAAVKYVKGEKVGELNLYINPGEPLGNFYYETNANGDRVLKTDRVRDSEGNPVTDEWLATQPDLKEQLQKLVDFFGPDAIIVGQNNSFDINILERFAEKLGIDFNLKGAIDTLGIARALQKIELAGMTFPENPSEGDEATSSEGNVWKFEEGKWKQSNKLADLAARLGIPATKEDKFHDALFDVEVTEKVLRALLDKMKAGEVPAGGSKTYDAKYSAWQESREKRKKELADIAIANAQSGAPTTIDELIDAVNSGLDEKISDVDGEEEVLTPKTYTSKLFGDTITSDWVLDPENTDFITVQNKDVILGDFMTGKDGQLYEVIGFADDEVKPFEARKILRTSLEDPTVTLDSRDLSPNTRKDGGTGFFDVGKMSVYRRKENAGKTTPQIRRDIKDPNDVAPKPIDLVPDVEPVKGEPLTDEQIDNVAGQAIAEIVALSKPQDADETVPVKTIEETVPDLNLDSSVKEQVKKRIKLDIKPGTPSDAHLSADGVPLAEGDSVINAKNGRVGKVSTLFALYNGKYTNYLLIRYKDREDREPGSSKSLTLVSRPSEIKVKGEETVTDIVAKIKDIQGDAPVEGAPDPEELAAKIKAAQEERDEKAKELNLVQISKDIVDKIKPNAPLKESTDSSIPSAKSGKPIPVTFAFDNPTVKDIKDFGDILGLTSEDIIVFKANAQLTFKDKPLAAIKPDGSITWINEDTKRKNSLEIQRVLQKIAGPLVNVSAMAIMPKPDKIEQEDFGNGTLTGTQESTFDYDTISNFPPTDEQIAIVDAVMEGKDVVVQALAGSGKTATLVLAARRLLRERPDKKLLYIVFNKETAEEALGRMPENVDSRTMDGVAASMYPSWVRDRLKTNAGRIYFGKDGKAKEKRYKQLKKIIKENAKTNKEMSPDEKKEYGEILASTRKYIPYGDYINLFDYYKFEQVTVSIRGTETNWGAQDLVKELREVIDSFAISKDDVISEKHFVKLDDKTRKVVAHYDSVPKILIDYANRMWDDLSSDEGWDPTSPNISRLDFSHLLKRWALTSPQFIDGINSGSTSRSKFVNRKNALFFFDEAQDMNPVIVDLLDKQEGIQKIYVGDSNQAIYGFRGAVDELGNVRNATELYLTRTFRFGDIIAGIANRFLTLLKSPKKIVGKPGEDFGKLVDNMEDPDAYIARTNAAIVAGIFEFLGKGKNPGLNLETYYKVDRYIKSAKWLMADPAKRWERPIMDDELAGYETWAQVTAAYYEGKNVGTGARLINRLKDDLGVDINEISEKIKRIAPIRGTGFKDEEYVPLTKEEALKEGETVVGNEKNNAGQIQKVTYEIKDGVITFKNTHSYQDFFFFKEEGWTYQNFTQVKTFTKEEEDDLVTKINDIRRWILNFKPRVPIDVEFITAHKSKGKQWKRVKLADDFPTPQPGDVEEDEGEDGTVLPSNEEIRVLYVAASRAEDALDIGENQKWIYNVTTPEDEKPTVTPMEAAMGMSIEVDPEPVTPEEVGNLIIEDQKVADKRANEVAQKIIALMEKGVTPWTKGWSATGLTPTNAFTKKSYQGTNLLRIWVAMAENGWTDNRFIGFGQAKKLGGFVRKGEKGTAILRPVLRGKTVDKPDGTSERVTWRNYEPEYVYNISQIENVNFPPLVPRDPIPVSEVETKLLELYKDHPTIRYEVMDGGKRNAAYYEQTRDEVVLPLREQFDTPNALIETLFHELAHSTGHPSRIGGKRVTLSDNYKTHYESRGEEELIAELSVALLAAEFGIEIDWGNTANYVDFWLKPFKENPDMITTAMVQAQEAVNYMLGKKPTYDQVSTKALYPNLQDYLDGGSGGLEGTRSTVGFVKTSALQGMNGNTPGNREMVEKYKASLTEGKGFAIREFEGKPFNDPIMVIYDNETGMAFVGEGNHRLQAAIELNLPYVPVRVVQGRASEMVADEKKGKSPQQIKNGKEPKFIETTGNLAGKPVSEGYIPPEFHPKYVFDEDLLVGEDSYEFPKPPKPDATPVGEGVGSEGLTGEQIAEEGGLRPEPTPEPNVGEQGQTGEEIASDTGVASIKGDYQLGTPNSGDLKDSMKYEIQMDERNLSSGQTTGGMYGVRKLVISGNTYSNREALKAAGFKYNGSTKDWSKSYLGKVFKTDTLTQEVLDNNPDSEITDDLSKFSKNPVTKSNVPKNKDTSVNPIKFKFFGEEYDLWNDISGEGDNDKKLENGHARVAKDLLLGREMIVERDEIDLYVSQILEKYGYGKKFVLLADGKAADDFLGDDPLVKDENGEYRNGQEAAVGLANDDFLELNHPLKGIPHPILLARERGTSKVSLLHEIAHLMEGGWRKGVGGGHNQTWHQTFLTLLRGEGFQEEADLIVSKLGEKEGDTGAIGS